MDCYIGNFRMLVPSNILHSTAQPRPAIAKTTAAVHPIRLLVEDEVEDGSIFGSVVIARRTRRTRSGGCRHGGGCIVHVDSSDRRMTMNILEASLSLWSVDYRTPSSRHGHGIVGKCEMSLGATNPGTSLRDPPSEIFSDGNPVGASAA
jgi:hypothetical protein